MVSASKIVAEGIRLHQAGDRRAARRCYEQANKIDPFDFDAIHMTGVLALQEGRVENAIRLIQIALRIKPSVAEAWVNLSNAYAQKNDPNASLTALSMAIDVNPDFFNARQKRAQMLIAAKRISEALDDYRYIANASEYAIPQDIRASAHFRMVECMAALSLRDEALIVLDTIDASYPNLREKVSRLRDVLKHEIAHEPSPTDTRNVEEGHPNVTTKNTEGDTAQTIISV